MRCGMSGSHVLASTHLLRTDNTPTKRSRAVETTSEINTEQAAGDARADHGHRQMPQVGWLRGAAWLRVRFTKQLCFRHTMHDWY